jgi:pimeloyl-ACP methyl ester carboxylesterase
VIGASSGGIVGMKLAARSKAKVAVVGVGWSFTGDNVKSLIDQSKPSEGQEKYFRAWAEQGDAQVAALYRSFGDLTRLGTRPLLKPAETRALAGRLLIINGREDPFFRPDNVRQLHRAIKGSTLYLLAGADHLGPLGPSFASQSWPLIGSFSASSGKRR